VGAAELQQQAEIMGCTVVEPRLGHHHPPGRGRAHLRLQAARREDVKVLVDMDPPLSPRSSRSSPRRSSRWVRSSASCRACSRRRSPCATSSASSRRCPSAPARPRTPSR
jgi:hypothetical protein